MILAVEHPIESAKYMIKSIVPAVVLTYLESKYLITGDERLLESMSYYCDSWAEIVKTHYPTIAPKRITSILKEIDDNLEALVINGSPLEED